jgi:hypothetical protein
VRKPSTATVAGKWRPEVKPESKHSPVANPGSVVDADSTANRVLELGVQHAAVHPIYIHQFLGWMRLVSGGPPSALYAPHQLHAGTAICSPRTVKCLSLVW